MYLEAYRLVLAIAYLTFATLLGAFGYFVDGTLGAVIAIGIPSAIIFKFIYF